MDNSGIQDMFSRFVDQVVERHGAPGRTLTINVLRFGIREERMTEIRDWSNEELDLVEGHAARFDGDALLATALSIPIDADVAPTLVASLCAPSPVAWM